MTIYLIETLKDGIHFLGRNVAAGVEDGEAKTRDIGLQAHNYLSILRGILHGIGQQIEVDALHLLAVRHDAEIRIGHGFEGERDMLFQQGHAEGIVPATEIAQQVERLQMEFHAPVLYFAEIKDLIDETKKDINVLLHQFQ